MATKIFSLVMATINRREEVNQFLYSLLQSEYDLEKIELIIVDQNEDGKLDNIVNSYKNKISIKHIKSKKIGLSINRNIGIKEAKGKYILFPDDDCKYLKNTLFNLEKIILEKKAEIILGRIVDEKGLDSIRKWPKKNIIIKKYNFYSKASSITMAVKNIGLDFDEELGAGTENGSCEDTDYIYKYLKLKKKIVYSPEIIFYHPQVLKTFSKEKAYLYGCGQGRFIRKNLDLYTVSFFIFSLSITLFRAIKELVKKEREEIWRNSMKGRINGFFLKKNKEVLF